MIGVAASPTDLVTAAEFFELFKIAWEPLVPGKRYGEILCADGRTEGLNADHILVYGSGASAWDHVAGVSVTTASNVLVEWGTETFPVYGDVALFDGGQFNHLRTEGLPVDYERTLASGRIRRIGYDLFAEIRRLLTVGQPSANATIPTLELHIAIVRQWLVDLGIAFVEVLARPANADFICCLTHDIDFVGIRRHFFDRTLAGFVVRASIYTMFEFARGRRTVAEAFRNLSAVCQLPMLLAGWSQDFWRPFDDYARIEDPTASTFFVVPFKDRPGQPRHGAVDTRRAVRYEIAEIADDLRHARARGSELGIHGLDAWQDANAGIAEKAELTKVVAVERTGIRMHWLYFAADSPKKLEAAGFAYDSTWGYNDAVGYRAGTSQVFQHPGSAALMELPLSIMDSALFSSQRMGVARTTAMQLCRQLVDNGRRFGGVLVINWHCRSLAPERLWGKAYKQLLEDVADGGRPWFATAGAAVDWFRWRRSIQISEHASTEGAVVLVTATRESAPGGVVRLYGKQAGVRDVAFTGTAPLALRVVEDVPLAV